MESDYANPIAWGLRGTLGEHSVGWNDFVRAPVIRANGSVDLSFSVGDGVPEDAYLVSDPDSVCGALCWYDSAFEPRKLVLRQPAYTGDTIWIREPYYSKITRVITACGVSVSSDFGAGVIYGGEGVPQPLLREDEEGTGWAEFSAQQMPIYASRFAFCVYKVELRPPSEDPSVLDGLDLWSWRFVCMTTKAPKEVLG